MSYVPYTTPFKHQLEGWEASKDLKAYAAFWEQGTGKSKLTIDTIGHLYTEKEITGAIVVAPNGVHRNWTNDELPTHMHPDIPLHSHAYLGERADTKWHQNAVRELIHTNKFPFLTISYNAWMTKAGKKAVWEMMKRHRCFLGLDESHRIKTPSAKATRSIIQGSKYVPYKRAMSGTPVTQGPFDLYSQIKFLDNDFWRRELDIDTFAAFKSFFGVWDRGWNPVAEKEYDQLVAYQNIPELADAIKLISSRVTKEDAGLNLPPKLYSKRYYRMRPAQQRIYDELENDYITFLENEKVVTEEMAMTRMMRLQQVLCGYIPADGDDEPTELIERAHNPRLAAIRELMEDVNGKTIIWARWTLDIELIIDMLKSIGRNPVRYDGKVSGDDRERAKQSFRDDPTVTDFVANSQMSEGLTLNVAHTTIYFNNSYKLIDRKQTEDRNHRIGQTNHVTYFDLVCLGTRDEHVIQSLIDKNEIASLILGDKLEKWL